MKIHRTIWIMLFLGCAVRVNTATSSSDMQLTSHSRAHIVIPAEADETERFAAEELQRYIQAMTSLRMPIIQESAQADGVVFSVGRTSLAAFYDSSFDPSLIKSGCDSFAIDISERGVVLVGGSPRGTLYSVYELLEQQGCRWFFPGELGECVPRHDHLNLPHGIQRHAPDFVQRSIDVSPVEGIGMEDIIDWAAKNRINWMFACRDHFVRRNLPREKWNAWSKRGKQLNWQWVCHNFKQILPSQTFFRDHPEFYTLYKGRRLPLGHKGMAGGNLCTTNSEVIKRCAEFTINWFDNNPDGMVVPLWPADGLVKWCECDECAALGGRNFVAGSAGSMTRRMVTFANAVARRVAPQYPDRYILCPAYSNYIEPVPDLPLEKNILVQYCLHGCYAHGVDRCAPNTIEKKRLDVWAQLAPDRIGVWEYFLLGDHIVAPTKVTPAILPVTYRTRDTIRYLKEQRFTYYFTQSSAKYWRHNPLPFYTTARLIWQSDLDFAAFWKDFFEKMYGPAGPQVSRFYRLIEEQVSQSSWHPQIYSDVAVPPARAYTPAVIEQCEKYLAQAEAQDLSAKQRQRLTLVLEAFAFVKANVSTQSASGLSQDAQWRIERHEDHYLINADGKEMDAQRRYQLVLNAKDNGVYDRSFERLLFRGQKRSEPIVSLENQRLRVALIPGLGGRMVRIIDKETGWNYLKEKPTTDTLDSIGESYFHYGGYEEYIGTQFAGPGWERPFTCTSYEDAQAQHVLLQLEIPDFLLRRTVSVPKNGAPEVTIRSVLTNTSRLPQTVRLRVHPIMSLGPNAGAHTVHMRNEDGTFTQSSVDRENGGITTEPHGLWAIVDESTQRGVVNIFDPEQATCYICRIGPDQFNMELFGRDKTLGYRESLEICHRYRFTRDVAGELDTLLMAHPSEFVICTAPPLSERNVAPLSGTVSYEQGKIGSAAHFDANQHLIFASAYVKAKAGTIEMWVKPDEPIGQTQDQFVLAVGDNSREWFLAAVGSSKITFHANSGARPYRLPGEYYCHLEAAISQWPAHRWRHVALVWANCGREKSLLQIYLDGQLKEERYNVTLGIDFRQPHLAVGFSTVSREKFFAGALDDLRISNYPKTAAEINSSYLQGVRGQPLATEPGTLLLLNFEKDSRGLSRTIETLDQDALDRMVQAMLAPGMRATAPASSETP